LAEAFLKAGNQVVIAGRRRAALDEVTAANPGMKAVELDIEDPKASGPWRLGWPSEFPTLNVVINNAGIMRPENLTAPPQEPVDAEAMITTNLLGPIRLTNALLPALKTPAAVHDHDGFVRAGLPADGHHADLLCDQGRHPFLRVVAALAVEGNQHRGD